MKLVIEDIGKKTVAKLMRLAKLHQRDLQTEIKHILQFVAAAVQRQPFMVASRIRGKLLRKKSTDSSKLIKEDRRR